MKHRFRRSFVASGFCIRLITTRDKMLWSRGIDPRVDPGWMTTEDRLSYGFQQVDDPRLGKRFSFPGLEYSLWMDWMWASPPLRGALSQARNRGVFRRGSEQV